MAGIKTNSLCPHRRRRENHVTVTQNLWRFTAAAQGNLAEAASLLEKFRVRLQGHLLTENVRLYIYLEHQLAGDPSSFALIHEFRQEMDGIGKALAAFLRKYQNLAAEPGLAPAFVDELAGVGKVLVERIQREEATLYPLYTA